MKTNIALYKSWNAFSNTKQIKKVDSSSFSLQLHCKAMTRKKVKIAFIFNDSTRKETYKRRKKGIVKKVRELTILCGIPACAIISDPFDSETEVWPNLKEAKQMIERYQNSYMKDERKNVNQESFLLQRITKAKEQLRMQRHDNHENELNILMFWYLQNNKLPDDVTVSDLKDLDKLIEKNMKEIDDKIASLSLSNWWFLKFMLSFLLMLFQLENSNKK